jgi:uncharacterized membrane protein YeiB
MTRSSPILCWRSASRGTFASIAKTFFWKNTGFYVDDSMVVLCSRRLCFFGYVSLRSAWFTLDLRTWILTIIRNHRSLKCCTNSPWNRKQNVFFRMVGILSRNCCWWESECLRRHRWLFNSFIDNCFKEFRWGYNWSYVLSKLRGLVIHYGYIIYLTAIDKNQLIDIFPLRNTEMQSASENIGRRLIYVHMCMFRWHNWSSREAGSTVSPAPRVGRRERKFLRMT